MCHVLKKSGQANFEAPCRGAILNSRFAILDSRYAKFNTQYKILDKFKPSHHLPPLITSSSSPSNLLHSQYCSNSLNKSNYPLIN